MDTTDNVAVDLLGGEAPTTNDLLTGDKKEDMDFEPVVLRRQPPAVSIEPPLRDSAPSINTALGSPSKIRPSSVIATKNTRKRMEDRHVVLHDLKAYLPSHLQEKVDSEEHVSYYGVFDGHAGTDAAAHAAAHLHELLVESSCYPSDPVGAFSEAFVKCDTEFVTKSKKSGTTAICSLIKGETIFTAWLGDSQAILVRSGQPVKIVEAHKPNREDERARIEALGGTIMHWGTWRVNGQLAVSRAIGDGEYKPFISAEPDVTTSVNNGTEEFMIIACDGLWDTITPEEATELVYRHLEENQLNGGDLDNLGARLATAAKDKGSGDNISIIVVFLKPVDDIIALGKRPFTGSYDMTGVTSTCNYVLHGTSGNRDSLESSRDKPDFTSPNVSFANLEGGQMFSPDPFGSVDNGFNISSEQFDNKIDDKRFSNESQERVSGETFNGNHMDEILKQQSIAKVEDLFKMLDREDSSPTPEDEDARPLEEILAAAREQPQDYVDGVEDDDEDSSDDEIVDFGACNNLEDSKGNANLEEVLKLDDKSLTEEQEETDTFTEGKDVFSEAQEQKRQYQEPRMDPCEQVTVKETGPQEYSTIVPPVQEMPTFQKPVIEMVDSMACSMVKEEMEPETNGVAKTNGDADLVSFDNNDDKVEGFMLKTPGQNGGELLAEFEPEQKPAADGHTGATLGIPDIAVTPATPVKEMSPAPTPRKDEAKVDEGKKDSKKQEKAAGTPKKSATPAAKTTATKAVPASKPAGSTRATPGKVASSRPAPGTKATPAKKEPAATKPTPARSTTSASRTATAPRTTTTSARPTSASLAGRTRPSAASDETKSNKSGTSSSSASSRQTPSRTTGTQPLERKPMPPRPTPSSAARKPAVPRADAAAKTNETKDSKVPPRRPASSSTLSKSSVSSTPRMSRQTSSASSATSGSRPRPATSTLSRPSSAVAKTATEDKALRKQQSAPRLTSSRTSSSSLRQTPSAAGGTTRPTATSATKSSTMNRTKSATTTRAANSTTAVKPSAAAERVAAARAAAMSKAPSTSRLKSKASTTSLKKAEDASSPTESKDEKVEDSKLNGHSSNDKENIENVNTTNDDNTGESKLVQDAGDSSFESKETIETIENPSTNGPTQTVNGLQEVTQSEC